MARPDKPIGDLEYEKFDQDSDGSISVKYRDADPFDHLKYNEQQMILLTQILEELKTQTNYLKNLFQGDII
jgi:hypothetical protein